MAGTKTREPGYGAFLDHLNGRTTRPGLI